MRRMIRTDWMRELSVALCASSVVVIAIGLYASPTAAMTADFDSTGKGFVPTAEVTALPSATIDVNTGFFGAADNVVGPSDVGFTGSAEGQVCILFASAPGVCQASIVEDAPYAVIMTLEIADINGITAPQLTGVPFTLAITMLDVTNPPLYTANEVTIALDPTAPPMLDTTNVPGFNFDGTFTPFVRIEDTACTNSGGNCNYLGWTVDGLGDTVTFRADVAAPGNRMVGPQLMYNAIAVVVPEPGTALLMGLGLAGLSLCGRRLRREP
jgi:hypothetical protein